MNERQREINDYVALFTERNELRAKVAELEAEMLRGYKELIAEADEITAKYFTAIEERDALAAQLERVRALVGKHAEAFGENWRTVPSPAAFRNILNEDKPAPPKEDSE
jgi:uncharacterized coiled-coil DUF342 family protein